MKIHNYPITVTMTYLVVVLQSCLKAHLKAIHDFLPLTLNDYSGVPTTHVPIDIDTNYCTYYDDCTVLHNSTMCMPDQQI